MGLERIPPPPTSVGDPVTPRSYPQKPKSSTNTSNTCLPHFHHTFKSPRWPPPSPRGETAPLPGTAHALSLSLCLPGGLVSTRARSLASSITPPSSWCWPWALLGPTRWRAPASGTSVVLTRRAGNARRPRDTEGVLSLLGGAKKTLRRH